MLAPAKLRMYVLLKKFDVQLSSVTIELVCLIFEEAQKHFPSGS